MKRLLFVIFAYLVIGLSSGAAVAGPIEDAIKSYDRGDYGPALDLLRPLAEAGDARAQFVLGEWWSSGTGMPGGRNEAEALKWYRRSAEQNYGPAESALSFLYGPGHDPAYGIPQDDAESYRWMRRAAEHGDAWSQSALGDAYRWGYFGLDADDGAACHWYRQAAEQDNELGQYNLGLCYAEGRGVAQDNIEAVMWLDLASRDFHSDIVEGQDTAGGARIAIEGRMNNADIAEAKRRARAWKSSHSRAHAP